MNDIVDQTETHSSFYLHQSKTESSRDDPTFERVNASGQAVPIITLILLNFCPACLQHSQHCIQAVTLGIVNQGVTLSMGKFESKLETGLS